MQCVDCHNRPTHTFQLPERAVNRAMALGRIPVSLPFIRKKSVEILRAGYASTDEAAQKIPAAMSNSKFQLGWAYVGAACVLGLIFFVAATFLEFVAVPWQRNRISR